MPGLNVPAAPPKPTILQPSETENQLVQGYQKETQETLARVEPIRAERDKVGGEMSSMPNPPVPKLNDVPQFQGRQYDQDQAMLFGSLALAVAGLATKSVRGDIGLALNTAASAMKGFNEGNIEQAKIERENFNVKMRSVIEQNNTMLAEYEAVMKDRKLTLAQKQQRYQVLATKYQDEMALAALKKGDIRFLLEREERLRKGNNDTEMKLAQIDATWNASMARMEMQMEMFKLREASRNPNAGTTQYTPEAVDMLARAAIKDKNSLANIGRGTQGARDLAAINNRMAEILSKESGPDIAAQRAEYRANSNSLNKMVMQYDAITSFEKNALANGKVLVDLAEKVDATGMPVLERWIRAGKRSIQGDPEVSEFHTQMTLFRAEAARILTNPNLTGTLTVHAQQEAETFINGNDSAEQISRVVGLLERDFKRREVTLVDQMNAARDRMSKSAGAGAPTGGSFANEAAARAAGKKAGDRVIINGVAGTLTD